MNYDERRRIYLDYLKLKTNEGDWHGVADCAMDLRELEATHRQPTIEIRELSTPSVFEALKVYDYQEEEE